MEKDHKKKQKKSLGQHFLKDRDMIGKIIELSKIGDNDVVYEVGSGNGVLTNELCKISKFVYSFEIDSYFYLYCKKKLIFDNLHLLNMDAFDNKCGVKFDVFFSSLPYYESRNAFSWLCQKNFKKGIVLLQREFVEKILSSPGEKNYRAISIITQHRFSVNLLLKVPCSSFSPEPKVDSVLIEVVPKAPPLSKKLIDDVQFLFSFRKKKVSFLLKYLNNLGQNCRGYAADVDRIKDKKIGLLSVEQVYRLALMLNGNNNNNNNNNNNGVNHL
jgi:16S rRNA (adenine1518-N6/adenine1519-N6)-dimethyltransferase